MRKTANSTVAPEKEVLVGFTVVSSKTRISSWECMFFPQNQISSQKPTFLKNLRHSVRFFQRSMIRHLTSAVGGVCDVISQQLPIAESTFASKFLHTRFPG